jgi:cytochrome c biogenesis protein CcmG, thiol:disulfide interchange protein DsbE
VATKTAPKGSAGKRPAGQRAGQPATTNRLPLLFGALAVVVLAVLVAVFSTAEDAPDFVGVDELAGNPTITGDPLVPFQRDAPTDPGIGSRAPVVAGADFEGTSTEIGASGSPQLIMFLASWCPACQAELPEVVQWLEAGNLPEGVGFTTVVTGLDAGRPNWPPDAWVEREGYDAPLLVDTAEGEVAQAYGLEATPYWVALDAEGRVAYRTTGMVPPEQLTALAESLAQG